MNSKEKHILLITDSYPPEIRSSSHLMQELAEEYKDKGYGITIFTSYPKYNLAEGTPSIAFNEYSEENGIEVIRLKTPTHKKVNFNYRGIAHLLMPFIFFFKGKKYLRNKKIDAIIVYSPPITLALTGNIIKKQHNAKLILNLQDIFPQNAIDLGILSNKILIKLFEWIEKATYKVSDIITVHSEGNKKFLTEKKHIPSNKVFVLHNWVDTQAFKEASSSHYFRKKYKLEDKFIILFAGVTGPAQELDLIIHAANKIKHVNDLCFLIVGDGTKKEHLVQLADSYKLNNVVFKQFVSKEDYPKLVKEVDVGLVCLSSKNKTPVVPGKMATYMSAKVPVLAFLNQESDGHKIIKESECGYSMVSDDYKKASELILKMYNNRNNLKKYGENGYKYVINNLEKKVCLGKLEELFTT